MTKESRVTLSEADHAALTLSAKRAGMKLATYLRYCALRDAASQGIHAQQPQAD
jgi:hypothetical protein